VSRTIDYRLFFEGCWGARASDPSRRRRELRATDKSPWQRRFSIEGRAIDRAQTALASAVSASAFRLLGIPLVRGRLLKTGTSQTRLRSR
jgi:hypothetical protein